MYIPIGPSKKQLYKIIVALLLLCYLIFLGMYKPKADVYNLDADLGVAYSNNAQIINQPNSNTTWNWGYNFNGISKTDAIEIYFHLDQDITSFNSYSSFMVGGYNTSLPLSNIGNSPFSVGGAILKVQGATYMCSVDSNNSNSVQGQNSYNTWSATINCDTSSGVNYGKSDNFASLWLQVNGFNGYSDFFTYIGKNIYISNTKIFDTANSTAINNIQNNTSDINNSINDSSIDSSSANDLTSNSAFQDSNGLDAIIKAPLNFIQSLTSSTCSSISLTIPYIDANVSLPCMSTIYNKSLGTQLVNLISLVINGVILYRYCLKILELVHNAKNPNKDELEVLDL